MEIKIRDRLTPLVDVLICKFVNYSPRTICQAQFSLNETRTPTVNKNYILGCINQFTHPPWTIETINKYRYLYMNNFNKRFLVAVFGSAAVFGGGGSFVI